MNEHDAPTVARPALWVDSANETTTRPVELEDQRATTTFAVAATAAPAETQVLDRHGMLQAVESRETHAFEADATDEQPHDRREPKPWQRGVSHAAVFALGVACALLVSTRQPSAKPQREEKARVSVSALPPIAVAPRPAAPPAQPELRDAPPVPAQVSLVLAVDALARGDYAAAHAQYAALARQRPNDAALARIAARLAAQRSQPCADDTNPEVPCVR